MTSKLEKGGGSFAGIKLLLCENPLPPLDEAIEAARAELPRSNHYTEAHSAPLRRLLADRLAVPEGLIHINAGSELILRQIFDRFADRVHLLTPTYPLFPAIARQYTETRLSPEDAFRFDLPALRIPNGTTLAVIVNPNNPNGLTFNVGALPALLDRHPETRFLVDEAFIGLAGETVVHLVPEHPNLLVTRTLSKAHSLAGFRVGYAVLPPALADDLNELTTPIRSPGRARRQPLPRFRTRARFGNASPCCANGRTSWRPACAPSGSARSPRRPTSSSPTSRRTTPGGWLTGSRSAGFWSSP